MLEPADEALINTNPRLRFLPMMNRCCVTALMTDIEQMRYLFGWANGGEVIGLIQLIKTQPFRNEADSGLSSCSM
ncbi:hypothetical protein O9992_00410 [Vibrio lentus]|nr:hypothetical protein [Vibrio lentus]